MRGFLTALSRTRDRKAPRRLGPLATSAASRTAAALRDEILAEGLTPTRARALADALESEGRLLDAVDALVVANLLQRDPVLERRLVRLRRAAFTQLDRSLPPPPWPPVVPDDVPPTDGPPEVSARDLTPGIVRYGILRHGTVLVRGLVPRERCARLRTCIDKAFEAHDETVAGRGTPAMKAWFDPIEDIPDAGIVRDWGRKGQGVFVADSPRACFEFLETVHQVGLARVIDGFLGERATLSVEKTTLRRADTGTQHPEWHQDGAFLGKGVRTVNAWIALSPCGRDAPGLDVIPVRLPRVLATGSTDGIQTFFDWVVSAETIMREVPGVRVWRPVFEPGDVLLFDHLMLHRTANSPDMPKPRYAVESWFFASSVYPGTSTPIVV